jgi:hypothetical protein
MTGTFPHGLGYVLAPALISVGSEHEARNYL